MRENDSLVPPFRPLCFLQQVLLYGLVDVVSSRPSVSVYRCVPRPWLPPGVFVQALQECLFALLVVFFGKPVTLNVETRIELRVGIF
jgi:hypothetical protein